MDRKSLLDSPVKDMKISKDTTIDKLMDSFGRSGGFTSAKVFTAYQILKKMFSEENTTFLSFPADIIATGTRGLINELVKRKMVDVIITTNGTLDHDIARTYMKYYSGSFDIGSDIFRFPQPVNQTFRTPGIDIFLRNNRGISLIPLTQ